MNKLKQRWGITSNWQLTIIFVVFAITGSSSVMVSKPILDFFGIARDSMPYFIYIILKIVIVLPVYQVLLVGFGFLFGQFKFFWEFEKKMLKAMGLGFLFKA
jgi:manganese efflux pump family protein